MVTPVGVSTAAVWWGAAQPSVVGRGLWPCPRRAWWCSSYRACRWSRANPRPVCTESWGLLANTNTATGALSGAFFFIEFHYTFSTFFIKYYRIMFIIIVFWLGCDRPSGHLFFMPPLIFSILTPLFLPPSSVSLSYFILAVPMRKCLVPSKHFLLPYWLVPYFFRSVRQWIIVNLALLNKSY